MVHQTGSRGLATMLARPTHAVGCRGERTTAASDPVAPACHAPRLGGAPRHVRASARLGWRAGLAGGRVGTAGVRGGVVSRRRTQQPLNPGHAHRMGVTVRAFFERFDANAVKVVKEGMEEAKRLGCDKVETEHLLYGFTTLRDGTSVALEKNKVSTSAAQTALRAMHGGDGDSGAGGGGGLSGMFGKQAKAANTAEMLPFAPAVDTAFQAANKAAKAEEDGKVNSRVLLLALLQDEDSGAMRMLATMGVDPVQLETDLSPRAQKDLKELVGAGGRTKKDNGKSMLQQCATDLTEQARLGKLDLVVGRDEEVSRMMRILVRRRKNNPALLGDPGVGKTAIAEGLAQRIVDGTVPRSLRGKRLLSLQLGLLVADTKYRGEFEERLKQVIEEVQANKDIILFIDELHTLMGAGSAGGDGGMDAAQLLKPALARGEMQCIGATTVEEYRRYVEKDAALERRFQPIKVEEPTPEQTLGILSGLRGTYEEHHEVKYSEEALAAAVKYSVRYINDRFLPDKAIDLMDEAGAMVQMSSWENNNANGDQASTVQEHHVAEVVAQWTGIPMQKLTTDATGMLTGLGDALAARVIGQGEATRAITKAVWRARTGLRNPARPIASLFFSGPTGVGKTELAKALAESYYGAEGAMVRIDMSEYMEAHAVARLVGPPPGYIGFEEGGQLTEAVRRNPHTVVLLDEVEKAHPDVFNILLQVLEDGRLTDSKGRTVNFRNALVIMTSNVGSKSILAGGVSYAQMAATVKQELQTKYRPEFLNRLDEIIVFRALVREESFQIADLLFGSVQRRCMDQDIVLTLTPLFKQAVVAEGFSSRYGARPLRRAVQRWVEDTLAECMLDGFVGAGQSVELDVQEGNQVKVTRGDGHVWSTAVEDNAGMDDSTFDEGPAASTGGGGDGLNDLVGMMSDAGLMPQPSGQ